MGDCGVEYKTSGRKWANLAIGETPDQTVSDLGQITFGLTIMLIGEYTHSLDSKKRVALPAKFRKELGKQIVITRGLDKCLWLYPIREWHKVAEKLAGLSMGQSDTRGFSRFMLAGAVETDVDGTGRILVPDFLREFAGLGTQLVLAGVHSRVEIWDERVWKQYKNAVAKEADKLAEKLGEIGAI